LERTEAHGGRIIESQLRREGKQSSACFFGLIYG
jgi:hypothetical protein